MSPGDMRTNIFDIPANLGNPYSARVIPVRYQEVDNRQRFVSCGDAKVQQLVTEPGVENICIPSITCLSLGYSCNPPGWDKNNGCTLGALNCGSCSGGQSCNTTGQCETPPVSC